MHFFTLLKILKISFHNEEKIPNSLIYPTNFAEYKTFKFMNERGKYGNIYIFFIYQNSKILFNKLINKL